MNPHLTVCWPVKGGQGVTVTAAVLALALRDRNRPVDLIDHIDGDLCAMFNVDPPRRLARSLREAIDRSARISERIRLIDIDLDEPRVQLALLDHIEHAHQDGRHVIIDAGVIDSWTRGGTIEHLATIAARSYLVTWPCVAPPSPPPGRPASSWSPNPAGTAPPGDRNGDRNPRRRRDPRRPGGRPCRRRRATRCPDPVQPPTQRPSSQLAHRRTCPAQRKNDLTMPDHTACRLTSDDLARITAAVADYAARSAGVIAYHRPRQEDGQQCTRDQQHAVPAVVLPRCAQEEPDGEEAGDAGTEQEGGCDAASLVFASGVVLGLHAVGAADHGPGRRQEGDCADVPSGEDGHLPVQRSQRGDRGGAPEPCGDGHSPQGRSVPAHEPVIRRGMGRVRGVARDAHSARQVSRRRGASRRRRSPVGMRTTF